MFPSHDSQGKGVLGVEIHEDASSVYIDISDTGKGIPRNMFKVIFNPGYTSKQRGWGLGLSLSKRIINEYHRGLVRLRYHKEAIWRYLFLYKYGQLLPIYRQKLLPIFVHRRVYPLAIPGLADYAARVPCRGADK